MFKNKFHSLFLGKVAIIKGLFGYPVAAKKTAFLKKTLHSKILAYLRASFSRNALFLSLHLGE